MKVLADMKADLEMLKTAFGNSLKVGPVEKIDAEKGYRLKLGDGDDGPYLSPWYPHPETGKTSVPLKKGQVVGVINPSGDPRQGVVFRGGYSDEHSTPNDNMDANVFADAGVRVEVAGGVLTITGNFKVVGNSDFDSGHVRHNDHDIGDTHRHIEVMPGAATTGVPQ